MQIMKLGYFEIKYFRWALFLLVLGFVAVFALNSLKPFHKGTVFVEQNSVKPIAIVDHDCDSDETKSSDIEAGEDGYSPLPYFSSLGKIALKNINYNPLLIPRFHINIRNSRAPPAYFHS